MGYMDVPCDIANEICHHNHKSMLIRLKGQAISDLSLNLW